MKIATWNVNSLRVRLAHVLDWLTREKPDVLALQETKLKDEDFPAEAFTDLGYEVRFSGQATYNGVALISREAAKDVVTEIDGLADEQRRVLAATVARARIYNLYVPNGQSVDSDKYRYKLAWLEALRTQIEQELATYDRCILLGDFNIAPQDRDVHDPEAREGKVLCSEPERDALKALMNLGFCDVFRAFEQKENSFSWWDYRGAAFRRNRGLRIDLILASRKLAPRCTDCRIDVEPRRLERPSDHTPVVAEFET
ncbi:MAG: exodeoxyribonuclease III [Gammaproteobacteria bacterium]